MSRYTLPDPKCRHKATVRISSHEDIVAATFADEPMASTQCCDRKECQEDAKAWLWASTHRDAVFIVPLRSRAVAR